MKSNVLFNKAIYLMAVVGLISLNANSAFSQEGKKKIVRVIDVDKNGEHVVKEFDVTNNAAKFDSISRDVHRKMKVEKIKLDSLKHVLMNNAPEHSEFPQIPDLPDMPDMPDFDFNFDMPEALFFGPDSNFEFFMPDSAENSSKIYYSEKSFDKTGNLDQILKDLENGTFDPKKWNMKEVEKDKIKDFKTNGKGEVIVFGNPVIMPPHIRYSNRIPRKVHVDMRRGRNGNRMVYINRDSLNDKDIETYTIESSDDSDGGLSEKISILLPEGEKIKGRQMVIYSNDSVNDSNDGDREKVIVVRSDGKKGNVSFNVNEDGKKEVKSVVIVNDDKTTKLNFTRPSVDDFKMLEKSDLAKEDKAKLLSTESLMFVPAKEKDKYIIRFQGKESGNVKFIIADEKGKTIKTEEFDHSKDKTEKEVEIKDLKSGVYFIQAQLNGKTTTSKLEIKID